MTGVSEAMSRPATGRSSPVPPSVAAERELIESQVCGGTVLTAFEQTVRQHGETEAFRWQRDGRWCALTYRELRDRVRDAALGLRAIGLRPGEFAVIWSGNRPEPNIADLAVMHARGVPVFLYNTLAPPQAAYIAGHCEATVAIVENREFLGRLAAVRAELPRLRRVIVIDGKADKADAADAADEWLIGWDELLELGRAEAQRAPGLFDQTWRQVGPEDLATLIYTSGTTGPPKGVMLTHHNVRFCSAVTSAVLPPAQFADEDGIRVISYLPMAHAAGRFSDHWQPMINSGTVAFCPDITQLFAVAVQVRPTVLFGVPRVWEKLLAALRTGIAAEPDPQRRAAIQGAIESARESLRHEQRGEPVPIPVRTAAEAGAPLRRAVLATAGLDACLLGVSGAAPIDPEVIEFFQALGLPMTEAWGMTELTCAATISHPGHARNGSVGTAGPGVELRLADDSEILVRAPLVMRGYYRDPERTAGTLDGDGWLHTGDVGTLDPGGHVRIVDRKKELIITSGGKNISPATIEALLQRHPLIGQACVIGDRRNYITALLVLDGEAGLAAAADLAAHPQVLAEVTRGVAAANEHLSRAEQVRRFTVLAHEWTPATGELTPTLKRCRRVIAERYAAQIEQLYGPPGPGVIEVSAE